MKRCCKFLNYVQYADDTTFYISGANLNSICNTMNAQLENIYLWLKVIKLSLDRDKTSYMIHTSSPQNFPSIEIRNNPLVKVTESKFLGVINDNRLSFKAHASKMCKKVSSAIGAIKRVSFFIPKSIIRTLYFSLLHPLLLDGICIWGSSGAGNIKRIKRLQKKEPLHYFLIMKIVNFL